VHELDEIVEESRAHPDRVITLVVGEGTLVSRLLARAAVEARADDTGPVMTERQRMHRLKGAPVASIYRGRGLLTELDGEGSQSEVRARLEDLVHGLLSGG
jgi:adenylate kinase